MIFVWSSQSNSSDRETTELLSSRAGRPFLASQDRIGC